MPRFSIVVPAYNAEATLAETLDAVQAQTFPEWECVVVDDGSTDGTWAIADSYARREPRLRALAQDNRGTGGAYNTGVRAAAGDWVTVCSSDDVLLPEHLATMSRIIDDRSGYDIYSCTGFYWHPDGSRVAVYPPGIEDEIRSWPLADVMDRCFYSVGACYRRTLFDELGGYREEIFGEDYDFWLRAMAAGARHLYVPEALTLHRVSEAQKSAQKARAYESDIRSITSILDSGLLSRTDRRAARAAIRFRKRLIAEVVAPNSPGQRLRRALRPVASRMRGR